MWVRTAASFAFICLLVFSLRSQQNGADLRRYENARDGIRAIANHADGLFSEDDRARLDLQLVALQQSIGFWHTALDNATTVALAKRNCSGALSNVLWLFDSTPRILRLSINNGVAEPSEVHTRLPYGAGAIVLRISQSGVAPGDIPAFVRANSQEEIHLGQAEVSYAMLAVPNPAPGTNRIPLRVTDAGGQTATVNLTVEAPPTGTLHIRLESPAVVGVYGEDDHLFVPENAVAFDDGGFVYTPGRSRPNLEARYWPGSPKQHRVFFSSGEFSLKVPEGRYTIIAGKGMEFTPIVESVEVRAGDTVSRTIGLKRWIDMPSRGWYSGDMHVHWARASAAANEPLMRWTQAEDVHVASVLRMGDAKQTYFEQYAFGKAGRAVAGNYALVPGQEDPRTNVIGHTLHLRLQAPVRDTERYYLYNLIFDEVARQGGLNGYAHMQQSGALGFFVRRDMTMEVPRGKTDFFELCEFGNLGLETYYEFLNLGIPLAAGAGSDVPWGNTIGTSRIYAYTGKTFDPDAWFDAVKAGHTFVTAGPMLDFTVNGRIPGSVIEAKPGDVLRIKASAEGSPVSVNYLEVVEQGAVIKTGRGNRNRMDVEFTIPVRHSTWLAARCNTAHTSPVYIKVGGERFWKRSEVPQLVANRLDELRQVEEVLRTGMPDMFTGNFDNQRSLQQHGAELRARIDQARAYYDGLLKEVNR